MHSLIPVTLMMNVHTIMVTMMKKTTRFSWNDGRMGKEEIYTELYYTHTHRHYIHTTKQILLLLSIRSLIASKYYLKKTSISTPTTTTQHHNTAALCDHVCPVFCAGVVDGSAHRKLLVVFP